MESYNIKGIFIQPFSGKGIFKGYDLKYTKKDMGLIGRLDDHGGQSSINGVLDLSEGLMEFNKQYDDHKTTIKYKFKKQGYIWVGEFNGEKTGFGESMCELYAPNEFPKINWEGVLRTSSLSINGAEKWSKNMIERMEQKGYLKIVTDTETGEEIVELLKKPKPL